MENSNTFHKVVTHIENVPEEWKHTNDFNSHRELLWLCVNKLPNYSIIEFGMGYGSTPLLKKYSKYHLTSIEENEEWRSKFNEGYKKMFIVDEKDKHRIYTKDNHSIWETNTFILNRLNDPDVYNNDCIYFVDNAPAEERINIIKAIKGDFKNDVQEKSVIIVHDTEEGADYVYHLKDILKTFKYRLDFKPEGMPATTAVSNFIDVTKWVD